MRQLAHQTTLHGNATVLGGQLVDDALRTLGVVIVCVLLRTRAVHAVRIDVGHLQRNVSQTVTATVVVAALFASVGPLIVNKRWKLRVRRVPAAELMDTCRLSGSSSFRAWQLSMNYCVPPAGCKKSNACCGTPGL